TRRSRPAAAPEATDPARPPPAGALPPTAPRRPARRTRRRSHRSCPSYGPPCLEPGPQPAQTALAQRSDAAHRDAERGGHLLIAGRRRGDEHTQQLPAPFAQFLELLPQPPHAFALLT